MTKKQILTFLILLYSVYVSGQISSDKDAFPKILGEKEYKGTTLTTAANYSIKYSKESCNIKCIDDKGQEKWTTDLNKLECELTYFAKLPNDKIKNCDIILQLKDKRIFVLKSKTGKIKAVSSKEFDKLLSKKRSGESTIVPK